MEQVRHFGDIRLQQSCVYCGGATDTRDHVPSKVLLDEPYPENLPVIPACARCNSGFSLDEEYLGCLVGAVLAGCANPERMQRPKIARILRDKPLLRDMLARARHENNDAVSFAIQASRVRNVLLKLALGHAAFEVDEYRSRESASVDWIPLASMDAEARDNFETPPPSSLFPEVGSRAMRRMSVVTVTLAAVSDPAQTLERHFPLQPDWMEVQADRYRYLVALLDSGALVVRIVLSEYLACEVIWG